MYKKFVPNKFFFPFIICFIFILGIGIFNPVTAQPAFIEKDLNPEPDFISNSIKFNEKSGTILSGSGIAADSSFLNFGTGDIFFSGASVDEKRGYLYSWNGMYFADVTSQALCFPNSISGYEGVDHIWDFTNAADHVFSTGTNIGIATINTDCNTGILLFRQNDLYGGIEFIDIDSEGNLHYNWWYDSSGGSDFSSLKPEIHSGNSCVDQDDMLNFGPIEIVYTYSGSEKGFLYSNYSFSYESSFANVVSESPCWDSYNGYSGEANIWDIHDAADYTFTSPFAIIFGTRESSCYAGILLINQASVYAGVEFLDIDNDGRLCYNWWYDPSGGSDFSSLQPHIYLPLISR